MSVKPILFSTTMVQAILDGRKTMTRRVMKPQPVITANGKPLDGYNDSMIKAAGDFPISQYQPGDILWVRETWQAVYETEYNMKNPQQPYNIRDLIKDFDSTPKTLAGITRECSCALMPARNKYYMFAATPPEYADAKNGLSWRSPIHMPKEAARIFLRVTDVRAERLQEITEVDAKREGVDPVAGYCDGQPAPQYGKSYRLGFSLLWYHLNAKRGYGWGTNPWVWVYSFERVDKLRKRYPDGFDAERSIHREEVDSKTVYDAAIKRVEAPNRVLTIDALLSLDGAKVYEECRTLDGIFPMYRVDGGFVQFSHEIDSYEYTEADAFDYNRYGATWRCWLREPTDDERAAIPWNKATL